MSSWSTESNYIVELCDGGGCESLYVSKGWHKTKLVLSALDVNASIHMVSVKQSSLHDFLMPQSGSLFLDNDVFMPVITW